MYSGGKKSRSKAVKKRTCKNMKSKTCKKSKNCSWRKKNKRSKASCVKKSIRKSKKRMKGGNMCFRSETPRHNNTVTCGEHNIMGLLKEILEEIRSIKNSQ
tara:strand:+ start:2103 stop:2405 length:303 start_codon:yes stop_codon:yes gene_type:complete